MENAAVVALRELAESGVLSGELLADPVGLVCGDLPKCDCVPERQFCDYPHCKVIEVKL
jgi:hypothetical protein